MKRLIFGSSVHVNFNAFLDLYAGVRKSYGDPQYIYASNENIGGPYGRLEKMASRRSYKWRRSHNFLFDAFEYLASKEYDYFIAIDSDCLVTCDGITTFLDAEEPDFVIYPNLNGLGGWYHGNVFLKNIDMYADILKEAGISRRDESVVGNFNPLIIFSRKAVDFLRSKIPAIERSGGYKRLMGLDFSVGETLVFNILKDGGFRYVFIDPKLKKGLRYRPYWEVDEYDNDIPIYHPVRRKKNDLFRRLVGIKAGYDKNVTFIPAICAYRLLRNIRKSLNGSTLPGNPDKTWFNP